MLYSVVRCVPIAENAGDRSNRLDTSWAAPAPVRRIHVFLWCGALRDGDRGSALPWRDLRRDCGSDTESQARCASSTESRPPRKARRTHQHGAGATIQRLLKTIRKGGVLGSVLGEPEGAKKYDIRVEAFMAQPDASRLYQLAEGVGRHEFSIPIARTMKLQEIQEAHRIFERGGLSGKIVLVP
jgi:hypothetical protein